MKKKKLSKEEYMATLPPKISKAGQWLLDHWGGNADYYIADMKAVLK